MSDENLLELKTQREVEFARYRDEVNHRVGSAIARREAALIFGLAKKIHSKLLDSGVLTEASGVHEDSDWVSISSLSQLRAEVGGRFKNLKEKWVGAGFPLRQHRGDRDGNADLNYDGWVELSSWVSKQGYDTKLGEETDAYLFAVRKRK